MTCEPSGITRAGTPALGWFAATVGVLLGSRPLDDNSFLTHLATGRLIVGGGGFPRVDPFTFTAAGRPWIVQSWLASVVFAELDRWFGFDGIRLFVAALCGILAVLSWRLTRPANAPLARLLAWAPMVGIAASFWSERPLLIGMVLLGVTLVIAGGEGDPRWLLAAGWVWANVHGSWPIGLVALGTLWVGGRLDRMPTAAVAAAAKWLVGGLVLGSLNPYGPRILSFPIELLGRRSSLQYIREWQPARFDRPGELAFLALLTLAVVGLCRRPSWTSAVPLAVFMPVALLSARNIPVAALVVLPGVARGLNGVRALGAQLNRPQTRLVRVASLGLAVVAVLRLVSVDPFEGRAYPLAATEWLEDHDLHPSRSTLITQDFVGNFYEARYGPTGTVFVDDRVEVMPEATVQDYTTLLAGEPGWEAILAEHRPAAVLWESDLPLAELLRLSEDWQVVYDDEEFAVFEPASRD